MRPVLLKSAGIVGLAGAIMAVVSSNALLLDPGGPDRSARPASDAPTVIAASEPLVDDDEIASLLPRLSAPEALPPAEDVQPETTASVIPAEPAATWPPLAQPVPPSPAPVTTPLVATEAEAIPPARELEPAPVEQVVAAADAHEPMSAVDKDARRPVARAEAAKATDPTLWSEDSVECPRDWVAAPDAEGAPAACETLASLVTTADPPTLRKALPEAVLDLVALAPTIPIPTAGDEPDAEAKVSAPPAEAKRDVKPKPVRANHRTSWPDEPPPNCNGLHAYWRFTDRKAGTKEWYCR
jgi:hypothetical protein